MNWNYCVFILCISAFTCNAVKLPSYINQCSLKDNNINECLKNSANEAIPNLIEGDKTIHVINLKPLFVPNILLNVGNSLKINLTNSNINGLESIKFTDVNFDYDKKRLDCVCTAEEVSLIGTYDISGRILILPINGNGHCNFTLVKPVFKYYHEFEITKKNNKKHFDIVKHGLTYDTERTYFQLDNLFNGDKQLGLQMNTFLNENWKDVHNELSPRMGEALSEIFSSITNKIYSRVPEEDLFF